MDYKPSSQSSFLSAAAAHWAIPDLEKKLAANPDDWAALNNLGNAYFMCQNTERALELFEKANALHPKNSVVLANLANTYENYTDWDAAYRFAKEANEADPTDRYAAMMHAECLLRIGQWRMGWDLYERCRLSIPQCPLSKLTVEMLQGPLPLEGARVLVLQEGGLGDVFLAFRFFKNLKELGARVTFAVDKRLHCLLESHPWVDDLLDAQGVKVTSNEYDCWISSFSLAGLFAPTPAYAIKQFPGYYFKYNGMEERKQIVGVPKKMKVGLCWKAGEEGEYHKHRALEDRHIQQLLEIRNIDWVCLQWPYSIGSTPPYANGMRTVDISDWEKTAEAVEDLDAVVTVETGLMFLAAALGVPTFTLLRNSYWYFLTVGQECVWFPNMKLFRSKGLTYDLAVAQCARAVEHLSVPMAQGVGG